jgi:hypothetical protein
MNHNNMAHEELNMSLQLCRRDSLSPLSEPPVRDDSWFEDLDSEDDIP